MHIFDGLLSPAVCGATGAISLAAVGFSLYKLRDSLAEKTVPMTGMMAALIFAGQMVNFPVVGFSGHLIGGVLAAVILGPWAGCLAMTLVLIVQCFLFADGGVLALGANVLNMAVIGALGGYAVMSSVRRALGGGTRGTLAAVVIASWLSVMAAAAAFCAEFFFSWTGTENSFSNIVTLMVTFHSAIGIGEALIAGGIVSFVLLQRPDLIFQPEDSRGFSATTSSVGRTMTAGFVCALAVAAFLAPFASPLEDGLETVGKRNFPELTVRKPIVVALAEYAVPLPFDGWDESPAWKRVSVSLAGILGTGIVLLIALLFDRSLKYRTTSIERSDGR